MSLLRVRPAIATDSRCIATVHVQSFREAHTGHVPTALSDALDVDVSSDRWARRLRGETPEGADRLGATWVALADERIIGFASSGPTRDADLPRTDVELYAIYVIADHWGTGAGAALLRAAMDGPGSVWVLRENPRAHAFYAKHGFRPDGSTRRDDRFGEPVHEVRWVHSGR